MMGGKVVSVKHYITIVNILLVLYIFDICMLFVYFGTVISKLVELPNFIISEPAFESSIFFIIMFVELDVLVKQDGAVLRFPNENDGSPREDVDTDDVSKLLVGICC